MSPIIWAEYIEAKPFKCPYCPLSFATQEKLDDHIITKHEIIPPPPPPTPPPEPRPCLAAFILPALSLGWILPFLRLFRDSFVPHLMQKAYYGLSKLILGGIYEWPRL